MANYPKLNNVLMTGDPKRPPIIVITSHVVRGGVGGRGVVFTLERLGFPVWFLPSIMLPWHPGQGKGTPIVANASDFTAIVDDLAHSDFLPEVGGIISGYLGEASQVSAVAKLVEAVKKVSPEATYLCDPVIGDYGDLYVPEELAEAVKRDLVPMGDILTPNRFELGWLTGRETESELQTLSAARKLGNDRVLVTSAPALRKNAISNLLVTPRGAIAAEHARVENQPQGTGDLMSTLYFSRYLEGLDDETALVRAAASTFEMVARSVKHGATEMLYAQEQKTLINPMALVTSRRVMETSLRV